MAIDDTPVGSFDVFISAKTEDIEHARKLREFLEAHELRVFLSERSVAEIGDSDYTRTIEAAIKASHHMVVVASSAEYVSEGWIRLEWTLFNKHVVSGDKPHGNLVTLLAGTLTAEDLPGVLGTREALPCDSAGFKRVLSFLGPVDDVKERSATRRAPGPKPARWPGKHWLAIAGLAMCLVVVVVVVSLRGHTPPASTDREFDASRDSFFGALPWLNWIVYDPTEYDPFGQMAPSDASIRADLDTLARRGFNGLVTMTCRGRCSEIARVAREAGFKKVIVGVWDIRDQGEMGSAMAASAWADAYCLGHRGVEQRYPRQELESAMARVRSQTHRVTTTSEVMATYESNPDYVTLGDFLFPDVHAFWHEGAPADTIWRQTVDYARRAEALAARESEATRKPKKPVLLKMVSFPSGGADGLTEAAQLEFYRLAIVESPRKGDLPGGVSLAFFSAFDEPWKTAARGFAAPEICVGLFRANREPKAVVTQLDWSRKFR